jgi:hydrogenase expression/formation protein HypD
MNLLNFSDSNTASQIINKINIIAKKIETAHIMEVCGTHTMEIGRLGIRSILPSNIDLISGPGCPVCVTSASYIDSAIELSENKNHIIVTFGDMIRVPGTNNSLDNARAKGADIRVVVSPLNAISIAKENPDKEIIFLAVGFETTAPATARAIQLAQNDKIKNLSFFVSHKLVPPALLALINDPMLKISAFLLPGHVSAIIGESPYIKVVKSGYPCVITGFEPIDILSGIMLTCEMIANKKFALINGYSRIVKPNGNQIALKTVYDVFDICDSVWRGIGIIPQSGLKIKKQYEELDAAKRFSVLEKLDQKMPEKCLCGEVLKGRIKPNKCPSFSKSCTPQHPLGPCMVSSEGSCAAYFKYGC